MEGKNAASSGDFDLVVGDSQLLDKKISDIRTDGPTKLQVLAT